MTWRQGGSAPRQRQVDREVMAAELEHPRGAGGRHAKKGEVILVLAESHVSAPRWLARRSPKDLVAPHDLDDLSVSSPAERGREEGHGRGPLCGREVAQAQPLAFEHSRGEVGPAHLLGTVEGKLDSGPAPLVQGGEKRLRGGDDPGGRIRGPRLRPRRCALRSRKARSHGHEHAQTGNGADSEGYTHGPRRDAGNDVPWRSITHAGGPESDSGSSRTP